MEFTIKLESVIFIKYKILNSLMKKINSALALLFLFALVFNDNIFADTPIGVLIPMSGPYADLGDDCKKGIEVARESFPRADKKTKFIYSDSRSEARTAMTEFSRVLNQDNVQAFITMRSPVGMAINPLSKQKKIPIIGAVGHALFSKDNPYAFQFWTTTAKEGEILAQHFKRNNIKKLSVVTSEDDWTVAVSDALINEFSKNSDSDVENHFIQSSETDFMPILLKIKSNNPDVIFLNLGISQLTTAFKRIMELKIPAKIYSNYWFGKDELIRTLDKNEAEKVTFIEGKYDFKEFYERLEKLFPGSHSTFMHFACYSSASFILNSIDKLPEPTTSDSLYEALINIKEVVLDRQTLKVIDRIAQFDLACKSIKDGKLLVGPC